MATKSKKTGSKKPAQKKPAAPSVKKDVRSISGINPDLLKHVTDNCPPNWPGTKAQFVDFYKGNVTGFLEEAQRAFAKLFPKMATDAAIKEADLSKAVAEIDFAVKVDFTKLDMVQFSGQASFTQKTVHKVSLGHTEELKQMDFLKDGPPGAAPNMKPANDTAASSAAPQNKAAQSGSKKDKPAAAPKAPVVSLPGAAAAPVEQPAEAGKK